MSDLDKITEIRQLIGKNELEEAADLLIRTKLRKSGISLKRRIKELEKNTIAGIISPEQMNLEKNRIADALLLATNTLENPIKTFLEPFGWLKLFSIIPLTGILVLGIWGVFFFTKTHSLTVLVHGINGKTDCVLPNRGEVILRYKDNSVRKPINGECEVTFRQVNQDFFGKDGVEIQFQDPQGEAYRAIKPDSVYILSPGKYISLIVELSGLDTLRGVVKNTDGALLEGATIMVGEMTTLSNENGYYKIYIPKSMRQPTQTIRARKEGYRPFELSNVPILEGIEIPIQLKSK